LPTTTAKELAALLNKEHGAGTIMLGSDEALTVKYLRTGVLPIDVLLEGGLPKGRFIEFFGDYSTLKSFIGLKAIATTQAAGGTCAVVDTEHAYESDWATELGINTDGVLVQRPETGEAAIGVMEKLISAGVDLIMWDSIAASLPKATAERDPSGTQQQARLAAMMSEGLRRLNAKNKHTAVLCLNQTRVNVGVMFGSNESVPGGKAMPFYASFRVALRKAGKVTNDIEVWDGDAYKKAKETTGVKIKATLEKSKLNSPHREAWFNYDLLNSDVDDLGFIIAQGLEKGLVSVVQAKGKQDRWNVVGSSEELTGMKKFRLWLEQNPDTVTDLKESMWPFLGT
jgi:recombination protein RecA